MGHLLQSHSDGGQCVSDSDDGCHGGRGLELSFSHSCNSGQKTGAQSEPPDKIMTERLTPIRSSSLSAVCSQPLLASLRIKIHSFSKSATPSSSPGTYYPDTKGRICVFSAFSIIVPLPPHYSLM